MPTAIQLRRQREDKYPRSLPKKPLFFFIQVNNGSEEAHKPHGKGRGGT